MFSLVLAGTLFVGGPRLLIGGDQEDSVCKDTMQEPFLVLPAEGTKDNLFLSLVPLEECYLVLHNPEVDFFVLIPKCRNERGRFKDLNLIRWLISCKRRSRGSDLNNIHL
ncbi:hypothetical protein MRB53_023743 [Persea americana]|uniref:Uncharacterized protein n=1 Tax=Persea americana TaxID=3435 RepID=A0ACC2LAF8_PERAE|nr:hypothetical protein MRB53_023743 [Persea americana]